MNHFFVIGAPKCATTSLYFYLKDHPQIFGPKVKEPKFFANSSPRPVDWQDYLALYRDRTDETWTFDASPVYANAPRVPDVPQRIHARFPDARLVYVVRHPIERIVSAYLYELAAGRETRAFGEAVFCERRNYVNASRYYYQISTYLPHFDTNCFHIVLFEQLIRDPVHSVQAIYQFLEIESDFTSPRIGFRANETKTKTRPSMLLSKLEGSTLYRKLPWRMRQYAKKTFRKPLPQKSDLLTPNICEQLANILRPDVDQLKGFLGREIPEWNL